MGVRFKVDSEDSHSTVICPGQGVLVRMDEGLGVAKVLAVFQVRLAPLSRSCAMTLQGLQTEGALWPCQTVCEASSAG